MQSHTTGSSGRSIVASAIALFCILSFVGNLPADTVHVPFGYATIQSAIDGVSFEGDTIVVAPGSYVENIDYQGKNIFLTSWQYYDGDDSYIEQTVLDGGQNGAVVVFDDGEDLTAVLNGFTVTNGSGHQYPWGTTSGGGIYIYESDATLTNCVIKNNSCCGYTGGGGILAALGSVYLSNLLITENSAQGYGGGLACGRCEIEMDPVNRCSIFLNTAGAGNAIYHNFDEETPPTYYLDTVNVATDREYLFAGSHPFELDILHSKLVPVQHDLWVSPDGDDSNSGSSPDDPLKTIVHAYHLIQADSLHPRTVHLLPGVYSPSGGQLFPINLRSYVSLVGSGREETILDMEYVYPRAMYGFDEERNYTIRSMSVIHSSRVDIMSGTSFVFNDGLVLEDMLFADNETYYLLGCHYMGYMDIPQQSSITIRNCDFFDNHCAKVVGIWVHVDALVQSCRFDNNTPLEDCNPGDEGLTMGLHMGAFPSNYPYPYSHRLENCVFTNNQNDYSEFNGPAPGLSASKYRYPLDIINCTFADNFSPISGSFWLYDYSCESEARLANCIFWDNDLYEIYLHGSSHLTTAQLSNCIVQGMSGGIHQVGDTDIIFHEGNFSADPLFLGTGDHPYQLAEGSPAIDAGTAFWVVDGDTVVNLSPDQYEGAAPDIGAYEFDQQAVTPEEPPQLPDQLAISSIHPNPFNNSTTIHFAIPRPGQVELSLYNIAGQLVDTIIDAWIGAGEHSVQFSADDYASGVYVVRLQSKLGRDSRLLTLVK